MLRDLGILMPTCVLSNTLTDFGPGCGPWTGPLTASIPPGMVWEPLEVSPPNLVRLQILVQGPGRGYSHLCPQRSWKDPMLSISSLPVTVCEQACWHRDQEGETPVCILGDLERALYMASVSSKPQFSSLPAVLRVQNPSEKKFYLHPQRS